MDVSPPSRNNWEKYALYLTLIALIGITLFSEFRHTEAALDPAARERLRHEWDKEIQAHERIRGAWMKEVAEHDIIRVGWENERQEIVREKEQWAKAREDEERRKEEEKERMRAGFYWADLQADQRCFRYGTRQYTARVSNVPREYDPVQACKETQIEINGLRFVTPDMCEDRVSSCSTPTCPNSSFTRAATVSSVTGSSVIMSPHARPISGSSRTRSVTEIHHSNTAFIQLAGLYPTCFPPTGMF
jgi:hypothetical protein